MGSRTLPFGYAMEDGQTVLCPAETEAVRLIYRRYADGCSLATLAALMQERGLPYSPGKAWNKNMIARILSDLRYTGTGGFPALLEPELFDRVKRLTADKAPVKQSSPMIDRIKRRTICSACGAPVTRTTSHRKVFWSCMCCGRLHGVTDDCLEQSATAVLKRLILSPLTVLVAEEQPMAAPLSLKRCSDSLQNTGLTAEKARAEAFESAAFAFDVLDGRAFEGYQIRYLLVRNRENLDALDKLLSKITTDILIHPTGSVALKLRNGQIVEAQEFIETKEGV